MGLPRVRIRVRGMMVAVAFLALPLWLLHHWAQRPYYDERARSHALMAEFCDSEARLMKERSESCWARVREGAPWDDSSEEAEDLKSCPYPSDVPRNGSWAEQAAVWDRAARKAKRGADRHARIARYFGGWSPIPPRLD